MKQFIQNIMTLAALLLVANTALAQDEVTIIKQLNGAVNDAAGTVTYQVAASNNECTLTVTPAAGNYVTVDYITAEKLVDGGVAQAPRRAPGMSETIAVTATDASADPSGVTTYTFEMPSRDYEVEVTVNFQTRQSISDGVLTLDIPETGYTYDGEAKTPAVTVTLNDTPLAAADYTVAYGNNTHNNIDAGEVTVTVTGARTYTGELTETFTIAKAPLSTLSVTLEGWTYGAEPNTPRVADNTGRGAVTYTYKVKDAADDTYTADVPVNAGNYTVKAAVAETANYAAGEATADFTISKAALGNLSVTLENWTYGDEANTPVVSGNIGKGAESFAYMMQDSPEENWSSEAPVNAGAYIVKATVAESANYLGAEAQGYFFINEASLADVTIADIADQTYTGSQITPAVTVTFKGQVVDASEYNVEYGENKNVGEGTVSLTTKGVNFVAADINPSKTFNIVPATAVITAEDQTVVYNAMQQEYDAASVDKGTLVVTYYQTEDERSKGSNALESAPTNAGVYYVQLTQGDSNYTSEPVDVTFTIEAMEITDEMVQIDEMPEFIYDGEAKTLEIFIMHGEATVLEEGVDYDVEYESNTNVGTAAAYITGKGNYQGQVVKFFQILREMNVSFIGNSWATYYAAEDLTTPEGLEAYIVTGVNDREVTAQRIDYIPQGVAVLLHAPEAMEVVVAEAWQGEAISFENNLLQGCAVETPVSELAAESNVYVLYNDEFVKTTRGSIPAFRCYLPVALEVAGARLAISFEGETTGLTAVGEQQTAGRGDYYNLNGQRVAQPAKGLFIVNGKKVVVK